MIRLIPLYILLLFEYFTSLRIFSHPMNVFAIHLNILVIRLQVLAHLLNASSNQLKLLIILLNGLAIFQILKACLVIFWNCLDGPLNVLVLLFNVIVIV